MSLIKRQILSLKWPQRGPFCERKLAWHIESEKNGRNFPGDFFKRIFLIEISLEFVPRYPINNIPSLFQTMARRRPGAQPLSEPMMVILLTHVCITWPQWVNQQIILLRLLPHLPGSNGLRCDSDTSKQTPCTEYKRYFLRRLDVLTNDNVFIT